MDLHENDSGPEKKIFFEGIVTHELPFYILHIISVADPNRLFPDTDPTYQLIPDPAIQIIKDPIVKIA
jgi:hypothetical protein